MPRIGEGLEKQTIQQGQLGIVNRKKNNKHGCAL